MAQGLVPINIYPNFRGAYQLIVAEISQHITVLCKPDIPSTQLDAVIYDRKFDQSLASDCQNYFQISTESSTVWS